MERDKQTSSSQEQHEDSTPSLSAAFRSSSTDELFASFHFFGSTSITPQHSDWMQSQRKIFAGRRIC
jgi:hypothetical protein